MALKIKPLTIAEGIGAGLAAIAAPFTGGATAPLAIGLGTAAGAGIAQSKVEDDAHSAAVKQANQQQAQQTASQPAQQAGIKRTTQNLMPISDEPSNVGVPGDTTKQAGAWSAGQIIPPGATSNGINHTQETPSGIAPSAIPSIASQSDAINKELDAEASPFSKLSPDQQKRQQQVSKDQAKLDADLAKKQADADKQKRKDVAGAIGGGIQSGIKTAMDQVDQGAQQAKSNFDAIFNYNAVQPQKPQAKQVNLSDIQVPSVQISSSPSIAPQMPQPVQNPNFGPDPNEELKKQLAMSDRTKKTQIKSANQELKHFLNLIYRGNHGR